MHVYTQIKIGCKDNTFFSHMQARVNFFAIFLAYIIFLLYLCTRKGYERTIIMDSMVLNQNVFSVSVPQVDTKKFKQLIKLMGWTITPAKEPARLYDPETGEYLNDETMRVIEDARQGKDIAFKGSFDEFKSWAEAL